MGPQVQFPPKPGVTGGDPENGVLVLNHDRIGHILPPHAPMALIIGVSCNSQPVLSEHTWVRRFNSRQKPGVTGGDPKNGVLVLNRDRIEHILPPHAPMALIIGASCSSQSGLVNCLVGKDKSFINFQSNRRLTSARGVIGSENRLMPCA